MLDLRRPGCGLSSSTVSVARVKRPHRPGRSLDTLLYSSHPCISSAARRSIAALVWRDPVADFDAAPLTLLLVQRK